MLCLFNNNLFILLKKQFNIPIENPVFIYSVRDYEESRSVHYLHRKSFSHANKYFSGSDPKGWVFFALEKERKV